MMDVKIIESAPLGLKPGILEQYFGVWAMGADMFAALASQAAGMNLAEHCARFAAREKDFTAEATESTENLKSQISEEGLQGEAKREAIAEAAARREEASGRDVQVAVIEIRGTMTKYGSSFDNGGSTVRARREIRNAMNDRAIDAILLRIDSPGGTVAGTQDLAAEVAAAAAAKPVMAYIEDLGASAAYWVASQARTVWANEMALVGSIGTYGIVYDLSAMAEQSGVKVMVFRAGEFKGAGAPGTAITEAQAAEFQRVIDEMNAHFLSAVGGGRKLAAKRVGELADGRVHLAGPAVGMGLIDRVGSWDAALGELAKMVETNRTKNEKPKMQNAKSEEKLTTEHTESTERRVETMSEATRTEAIASAGPVAATYAELKTALVGADAAFICQCLEKGLTTSAATGAWMAEQQKRLEAKDAEVAAAKAKRPGVTPAGELRKDGGQGTKDAGGDATAEWERRIEERMEQKRETRARATQAVAREEPELREAMVAAHNAARPARRR